MDISLVTELPKATIEFLTRELSLIKLIEKETG